MTEVMVTLVVLAMTTSLTYMAERVDKWFGWALVGLFTAMLLLALIILLDKRGTSDDT
jgi:hypothetical protein